MDCISSKLCWIRNRNTAKNTRRNTTSLTPGMEAFPSTLCEICISFTVKTSESTPHPMGRMATFHTPCAMSYMETLPDVVSMEPKSAPRIPS